MSNLIIFLIEKLQNRSNLIFWNIMGGKLILVGGDHRASVLCAASQSKSIKVITKILTESFLGHTKHIYSDTLSLLQRNCCETLNKKLMRDH